MASGKKCILSSVYTVAQNGRAGCGGWLSTSFEECKLHCKNNDVLEDCPNKRNCSYFQYNEGKSWCHLCDSSMVLENSPNTAIYRKQGMSRNQKPSILISL